MDDELQAALSEARALGYLGPGPLAAHEASARGFIEALGELAGAALDLGSGGGVPGLILAGHYREVRWVLLDQNRRRTSFLAHRLAVLGWSNRVTVHRAAAEDAGHDAAFRGSFAAVVARSFGPPAVTAECAVAFLAPHGRLAVAEPPERDEEERWPVDGLATIGLRRSPAPDRGVAVFEVVSPAPPDVPRSRKAMARSPRW